MKRIGYTISALVLSYIGFAQTFSVDCSTAAGQTIPVNGSCSAILSVNNAVGNPVLTSTCANGGANDGWLNFTAATTSTDITFTAANNNNCAIMVYSGASCASLTLVNCFNNDGGGTGSIETAEVTTVAGAPYYIRIVKMSGGGTSTGSVCVSDAPVNNSCATATSLVAGTACTTTNGTTLGASESVPLATACGGNNNDDVWYSFVATNTNQNILVNPANGMDAVIQLFVGSCASLTSAICADSWVAGYPESMIVTGFTAGTTYYFRVYEYGSGTGGAFSVCVNTPITPAGNNNCPGALSITDGVVINGSNFSFDTQCTQTLCSDPNTTDCFITPNPPGCLLDDYASCMSLETNAWYTFTPATSGNYFFNLYNQQCIVGDGMQLWIGRSSSSCPSANSFTEVYCQSNATPETITINANLTAGVSYYVVADGFAGDECNYSMLVSATISLPVELINFRASHAGEHSGKIEWTTLSYDNFSRFEIEKSLDGQKFVTIGKVAPQYADKSMLAEDFIFYDEALENENYYRLKMVDKDGKFDYSSVITLDENAESSRNLFKIIPNPTENNSVLYFSVNKTEWTEINILSLEGSVLFTKKVEAVKGSNSFELPVSELPQGYYIVSMKSFSGIVSAKLVKIQQ